MKSGLLLWLYRQFQTLIVSPWVQRARGVNTAVIRPVITQAKPLWFHAASVGELEALWLVILEAASQKHSLVLTVFSRSALSALQKLVASVEAIEPSVILYAGFSPWEGGWQKALVQYHPSVFITHKYEAWPDLWSSLALQHVPLVIVGARDRKSLRIAKKMSQIFVGAVPKLFLLPFLIEDEAALLEHFVKTASAGAVGVVTDTRWQRVLSRVEKRHSRVEALRELTPLMNKRVGVLGSAWLADLKFLEPVLRHLQEKDFLWIVPHCVDEETIQSFLLRLKQYGIEARQTSQPMSQQQNTAQTRCWIVDEMGILAELYATADWAYVGGGWGDGVHSTIEPAVQGIPIAIGPNRATEFAEISELRAVGQVTLFASGPSCTDELKSWWSTITEHGFKHKKEAWKSFAQGHQGATVQIMGWITRALNHSAL